MDCGRMNKGSVCHEEQRHLLLGSENGPLLQHILILADSKNLRQLRLPNEHDALSKNGLVIELTSAPCAPKYKRNPCASTGGNWRIVCTDGIDQKINCINGYKEDEEENEEDWKCEEEEETDEYIEEEEDDEEEDDEEEEEDDCLEEEEDDCLEEEEDDCIEEEDDDCMEEEENECIEDDDEEEDEDDDSDECEDGLEDEDFCGEIEYVENTSCPAKTVKCREKACREPVEKKAKEDTCGTDKKEQETTVKNEKKTPDCFENQEKNEETGSQKKKHECEEEFPEICELREESVFLEQDELEAICRKYKKYGTMSSFFDIPKKKTKDKDVETDNCQDEVDDNTEEDDCVDEPPEWYTPGARNLKPTCPCELEEEESDEEDTNLTQITPRSSNHSIQEKAKTSKKARYYDEGVNKVDKTMESCEDTREQENGKKEGEEEKQKEPKESPCKFDDEIEASSTCSGPLYYEFNEKKDIYCYANSTSQKKLNKKGSSEQKAPKKENKNAKSHACESNYFKGYHCNVDAAENAHEAESSYFCFTNEDANTNNNHENAVKNNETIFNDTEEGGSDNERSEDENEADTQGQSYADNSDEEDENEGKDPLSSAKGNSDDGSESEDENRVKYTAYGQISDSSEMYFHGDGTDSDISEPDYFEGCEDGEDGPAEVTASLPNENPRVASVPTPLASPILKQVKVDHVANRMPSETTHIIVEAVQTAESNKREPFSSRIATMANSHYENFIRMLGALKDRALTPDPDYYFECIDSEQGAKPIRTSCSSEKLLVSEVAGSPEDRAALTGTWYADDRKTIGRDLATRESARSSSYSPPAGPSLSETMPIPEKTGGVFEAFTEMFRRKEVKEIPAPVRKKTKKVSKPRAEQFEQQEELVNEIILKPSQSMKQVSHPSLGRVFGPSEAEKKEDLLFVTHRYRSNSSKGSCSHSKSSNELDKRFSIGQFQRKLMDRKKQDMEFFDKALYEEKQMHVKRVLGHERESSYQQGRPARWSDHRTQRVHNKKPLSAEGKKVDRSQTQVVHKPQHQVNKPVQGFNLGLFKKQQQEKESEEEGSNKVIDRRKSWHTVQRSSSSNDPSLRREDSKHKSKQNDVKGNPNKVRRHSSSTTADFDKHRHSTRNLSSENSQHSSSKHYMASPSPRKENRVNHSPKPEKKASSRTNNSKEMQSRKDSSSSPRATNITKIKKSHWFQPARELRTEEYGNNVKPKRLTGFGSHANKDTQRRSSKNALQILKRRKDQDSYLDRRVNTLINRQRSENEIQHPFKGVIGGGNKNRNKKSATASASSKEITKRKLSLALTRSHDGDKDVTDSEQNKSGKPTKVIKVSSKELFENIKALIETKTGTKLEGKEERSPQREHSYGKNTETFRTHLKTVSKHKQNRAKSMSTNRRSDKKHNEDNVKQVKEHSICQMDHSAIERTASKQNVIPPSVLQGEDYVGRVPSPVSSLSPKKRNPLNVGMLESNTEKQKRRQGRNLYGQRSNSEPRPNTPEGEEMETKGDEKREVDRRRVLNSTLAFDNSMGNQRRIAFEQTKFHQAGGELENLQEGLLDQHRLQCEEMMQKASATDPVESMKEEKHSSFNSSVALEQDGMQTVNSSVSSFPDDDGIDNLNDKSDTLRRDLKFQAKLSSHGVTANIVRTQELRSAIDRKQSLLEEIAGMLQGNIPNDQTVQLNPEKKEEVFSDANKSTATRAFECVDSEVRFRQKNDITSMVINPVNVSYEPFKETVSEEEDSEAADSITEVPCRMRPEGGDFQRDNVKTNTSECESAGSDKKNKLECEDNNLNISKKDEMLAEASDKITNRIRSSAVARNNGSSPKKAETSKFQPKEEKHTERTEETPLSCKNIERKAKGERNFEVANCSFGREMEKKSKVLKEVDTLVNVPPVKRTSGQVIPSVENKTHVIKKQSGKVNPKAEQISKFQRLANPERTTNTQSMEAQRSTSGSRGWDKVKSTIERLSCNNNGEHLPHPISNPVDFPRPDVSTSKVSQNRAKNEKHTAGHETRSKRVNSKHVSPRNITDDRDTPINFHTMSSKKPNKKIVYIIDIEKKKKDAQRERWAEKNKRVETQTDTGNRTPQKDAWKGSEETGRRIAPIVKNIFDSNPEERNIKKFMSKKNNVDSEGEKKLQAQKDFVLPAYKIESSNGSQVAVKQAVFSRGKSPAAITLQNKSRNDMNKIEGRRSPKFQHEHIKNSTRTSSVDADRNLPSSKHQQFAEGKGKNNREPYFQSFSRPGFSYQSEKQKPAKRSRSRSREKRNAVPRTRSERYFHEDADEEEEDERKINVLNNNAPFQHILDKLQINDFGGLHQHQPSPPGRNKPGNSVISKSQERSLYFDYVNVRYRRSRSRESLRNYPPALSNKRSPSPWRRSARRRSSASPVELMARSQSPTLPCRECTYTQCAKLPKGISYRITSNGRQPEVLETNSTMAKQGHSERNQQMTSRNSRATDRMSKNNNSISVTMEDQKQLKPAEEGIGHLSRRRKWSPSPGELDSGRSADNTPKKYEFSDLSRNQTLISKSIERNKNSQKYHQEIAKTEVRGKQNMRNTYNAKVTKNSYFDEDDRSNSSSDDSEENSNFRQKRSKRKIYYSLGDPAFFNHDYKENTNSNADAFIREKKSRKRQRALAQAVAMQDEEQQSQILQAQRQFVSRYMQPKPSKPETGMDDFEENARRTDPKGTIMRAKNIKQSLKDDFEKGVSINETLKNLQEWNLILFLVIFTLFLGTCCPGLMRHFLMCPFRSVCDVIRCYVLKPFGVDETVDKWRGPGEKTVWQSFSPFTKKERRIGLIYIFLYQIIQYSARSANYFVNSFILPIATFPFIIGGPVLNAMYSASICAGRIFLQTVSFCCDCLLKEDRPQETEAESKSAMSDDFEPDKVDDVSSNLHKLRKHGSFFFYLGFDDRKEECNFNFFTSALLTLIGRYPKECL